MIRADGGPAFPGTKEPEPEHWLDTDADPGDEQPEDYNFTDF